MQPSTTDDPTARIIRAIYTSAAVVAATVLFAAFFVMRPALASIEDRVDDVRSEVGDVSGEIGRVRRNTEDLSSAFDRQGRLRVVVEGR